MQKLKDVVYNNTYLILFNFTSIILLSCVFNILINNTIYLYLNYGLKLINLFWGIIVAIRDICDKKIDLKDNKVKILLLFNIVAMISWILFAIRNHSLRCLYDVILLYEYSFIFYTYYKEHSLDEIHYILKYVSYLFCSIVFAYNVISLIFYFTGVQTIVFPSGEIHEMYSFYTDSVAHNDRYMGLWPWYTTSASRCYLAVILHLYLMDMKKNKISNLIGIFLACIMICFTNSRMSILLLCLIAVCALLFSLHKKIAYNKLSKIALGLFLLGVIGGTIYYFAKNPTLLQSMKEDPVGTLDAVSSCRLTISNYIISNNDKWILGWGYANNELLINSWLADYPHNIVMALLLYTGIIGLVVFTLFILVNIIDIKKIYKKILNSNLRWIFVFTILIGLESFVDNSIIGAYSTHIQTMCFWFCFGCIYACKEEKI